MKNILLFSLTPLIICGCNYSRSNEQVAYEHIGEISLMQRVDSEPAVLLDIENATVVDYDELIEELKYIPLGKEKGLIGIINNIIYHNERIYIQDKGQDQVFIFDMTGKCIKKISTRGRGPKEYLGIGNIDINVSKNELIITDVLSGRSMFYDLDGNYKYSYNIPFDSDGMRWLCDSTFLHLIATHQNSQSKELGDYGMLVTQGDSLIAKGFKYLPSQVGYVAVREYLRRGFDKIYYRPLFSDSIYAISNDLSYSLSYYTKFKNSTWKKNYKSSKFVQMMDRDQGQWLFPWFYETQDFFLGYTMVSGNSNEINHVIYDKKKKVTYVSHMKKYDNVTELNRFWGYVCQGIMNEYFISACDAIVFEEMTGIKKRLKNGSLIITDPVLERIVKNIGNNDNPVLILTKFRSI